MKSKTTLHVLLVLSMIWAGLSCLSNLMMGLLLPFFQDYYTSHPGLMPEEFYVTMERMFEVPKSYYLVCSLLFALELAGAILMWNLRRSGFHSYTIARLLLLLLPLLFLGRGYVAVGDIMFALLFILVYYLLLRQLGVFGAKSEEGGE